MRCPNDSSDLIVTERHGINVRVCPTCQGIWLSEGVLDDIVASAIAGESDDETEETGRDANRKPRRRDKYSDDFDAVERPRKSKKKRSTRDMVEEYADY